MFRQESLRCVLGETALDHLLDAEGLDSQQVEDHGIGQAELRLQLGRLTEQHVRKRLTL